MAACEPNRLLIVGAIPYAIFVTLSSRRRAVRLPPWLEDIGTGANAVVSIPESLSQDEVMLKKKLKEYKERKDSLKRKVSELLRVSSHREKEVKAAIEVFTDRSGAFVMLANIGKALLLPLLLSIHLKTTGGRESLLQIISQKIQ